MRRGAKLAKTTTVSVCSQCPFFKVVDMEHIMLCSHPYWNDKPAYSGAIIDQTTKHGIPGKCPLWDGPVTVSETVELEHMKK